MGRCVPWDPVRECGVMVGRCEPRGVMGVTGRAKLPTRGLGSGESSPVKALGHSTAALGVTGDMAAEGTHLLPLLQTAKTWEKTDHLFSEQHNSQVLGIRRTWRGSLGQRGGMYPWVLCRKKSHLVRMVLADSCWQQGHCITRTSWWLKASWKTVLFSGWYSSPSSGSPGYLRDSMTVVRRESITETVSRPYEHIPPTLWACTQATQSCQAGWKESSISK